MRTTLGEIHRDPAIINRAVAVRERLDIVAEGFVQATLIPARSADFEAARKEMGRRFAAPDWRFEMATTMTRDERNSRG